MSRGAGPRELPVRPAVPFSLYALASAMVTARLVLCGIDARLVAGLSMTAIALVIAAWALPRGKSHGRAPGALPSGCVAVAAAVLAASLVSSGLAWRMDALSRGLGTSAVSTWEFELAGDMSPSKAGWRGRAHAVSGDVRGDVWLSAPDRLDAGSRLVCVGRFSSNADDAWGATSRSQGIAGTVRVARLLTCEPARGPRGLLLSLRRGLIELIDPTSSDSRALLAACLCGYGAAMRQTSLADELSCAGVSHMAAVSGAHLALVSACLSAVLERCGTGRVARCVAVLLVCGLFVLFCGSPTSAVRAWAMAGAAEVSALGGRRGHQLSSVSAVGLAMVLADPGVAGQLGFLLSVLSVCGIALFGGYATFALDSVLPDPRLPRPLRTLRANVVSVLAISAVCQAFTIPVTAAAFGSLSTLAPMANLVATPTFAALMPLGLMLAAASWLPPASGVLLCACDTVARPFLLVVHRLSSLPLARVPVEVDAGVALLVLVALSVALILWWPRPSARAVFGAAAVATAACACVLVRWRYFAPAQVCVLDVGQGDAILVRDGAAAFLVDSGPDDSVTGELARAHAYHLDAILVTHLHDDHYGGIASLRGTVGVDRVIFGQGVSPCLPEGLSEAVDALCPGGVSEVSYGDVVHVGRFTLRVVSPTGASDGSENADSVELLLEFSDGTRRLTALLTGDAEGGETRAAILRGDVGDVDLLKVGHHGSAGSLDELGASVLLPEVSVASAGEGNAYGHPRRECVELLEAHGSTFLCTKDVGHVCVEPGAAGPRVTCGSSRDDGMG